MYLPYSLFLSRRRKWFCSFHYNFACSQVANAISLLWYRLVYYSWSNQNGCLIKQFLDSRALMSSSNDKILGNYFFQGLFDFGFVQTLGVVVANILQMVLNGKLGTPGLISFSKEPRESSLIKGKLTKSLIIITVLKIYTEKCSINLFLLESAVSVLQAEKSTGS